MTKKFRPPVAYKRKFPDAIYEPLRILLRSIEVYVGATDRALALSLLREDPSLVRVRPDQVLHHTAILWRQYEIIGLYPAKVFHARVWEEKRILRSFSNRQLLWIMYGPAGNAEYEGIRRLAALEEAASRRGQFIFLFPRGQQ